MKATQRRKGIPGFEILHSEIRENDKQLLVNLIFLLVVWLLPQSSDGTRTLAISNSLGIRARYFIYSTAIF